MNSAALNRLTLYAILVTHELLADYADWFAGALNAVGKVPYPALERVAVAKWKETMVVWRNLLFAAQDEATKLAFGVAWKRHNRYFAQRPVIQEAMEEPDDETKQTVMKLWQYRRRAALKAAQERIGGDQLQLSDRIWRLDNKTQKQIRSTLSTAFTERTSTRDLALQMEQYLGVDRDLPRWTSTRLYKMTPKERAASKKGLLHGAPNKGKGIAYNAVRLARTELQYANHAASREVAKNVPWVDGRRVRLNPGHPKIDICDDYANLDDPLPADTDVLPLHPNCMCYYEDVLQDEDEFFDDLKEWMNGGDNLRIDWYQDEFLKTRYVGKLPPVPGETDALELWLSSAPDAHAVATKLPTRWRPDRPGKKNPIPRPRKAKPKKVKEEPPLVDKSGFPESPEGLEVVKDLGGSTGAQLVKDANTGRLYVRKRGKNPGHLREEVMADEMYQRMGVKVPPFRLYEGSDGPTKLAEFIPGKTLADLQKSNPTAYKNALKQLQKDFAADAVLGNWDVVGLSMDNVLVGEDGTVWRIDNGGSLRRRAQGQMKGDAWNAYPTELWTLRKELPGLNNSTTRAVYGDMTWQDVVAQMKGVQKYRQNVLDAATDSELAAVLGQRFDVLADLGNVNDAFFADQWTGDYLDDFSRHLVGIQKAGISAGLPKKFTARGTILYDENGKAWDNLRADYGNSSAADQTIPAKFANYLANDGGGDWGMIEYWGRSQGQDSWTNPPMAAKWFYARQRDVPMTDYWWKKGTDKAQFEYERAVASLGPKYESTFTAWHAFNYELARKIDWPNKDAKKGTITLIRTEDEEVMRVNKLNKGESKIIPKGAVESYSLVQPVYVHGSELTRQDVPLTRIFGFYATGRNRNIQHSNGMFLGDNENEVVAMTEGIPTKYEKGRR